MIWQDRELIGLVIAIIALLAVATAIGQVLRVRLRSESQRPVVANLNARVLAWWVLMALFAASASVGPAGTTLLFAATSFLALREFATLAPTARADHRALFWSFFVVLPIQYWLVYEKWYGLFAVFIPVYAFVLLPARLALAGDTERFLHRASQLQLGVLICVYFVSHVPALLMLPLRGEPDPAANLKLLFFFVTVVQLSDVFQYVWGKMLGRHRIAPGVSPNKTWEGFIGGVAMAVAVAAGLSFLTPFGLWWATAMGLAVCLMGFAGGLVMSAIKRDVGVKDFGETLPGHGGVLDRVDSICFAAPVFFHLTRYFFTQ